MMGIGGGGGGGGGRGQMHVLEEQLHDGLMMGVCVCGGGGVKQMYALMITA